MADPHSDAGGDALTDARAVTEAVAVVNAWLDAVNAADVERVLASSAPDVEIVGPRGVGRGREILREWLVRAGASFVTLGVSQRGEQVVVEQLGVWRVGGTESEVRVATRFVVRAGRVHQVQRYEGLEQALRDAGIAALPREG